MKMKFVVWALATLCGLFVLGTLYLFIVEDCAAIWC